MNRTYLRALSVAFSFSAAAMSFAQGWVWYCDDPSTSTPPPFYSIDYGGNGVGNALFAATMAVQGTAIYEACWPSSFTGNAAGGLDFNIGTLGSVQTNQDELTELIFGGGFVNGTDQQGNDFYGPAGTRSDWMYMATLRQGDTDANPSLKKFGTSAIDTFFFGASDRYMIAQSTQDNIRVALRVDSVGDAARVQWDLTNLGAQTNIGMWFGQYVFPIENYASNPKPISVVNVPGFKPLEVNRRFQRNPNTSPDIDPLESPMPDTMDFMVTQARAWEGLRIINSPTDATGSFPDQTPVDGLDYGLPGFLLGAIPGNDSVFPDLLHTDIGVEAGESTYIQKWNPRRVEASDRPISERRVTVVAYYKTTWGDSNFSKPYAVVIDSSKVVGVQDTDPFTFVRNPSTLRVYIDNIRGFTTAEQQIAIDSAKITLTLPQGMGDAADLTRRTITKFLSNIGAKKIKFVDFQIAALPTTFGTQQFQIKVEPTPGPTKIVTGNITVASQPYLQITQNANLVGSPWVYSNSNWASILGSGPNAMQPDIDYQAFEWNADLQQFTLQTSPKRGIGNWLISTKTIGFKKLAGGPQTPQDLSSGAPLIQLKAGWNLIADPYNYPIPLGQLVGVPGSNDSSTFTYQGLVDQGTISGSLAAWDPGTQSYKFIGQPEDVMQPNTGYWVDCLDPLGVAMDYPPVFLPFIPQGTGGIQRPGRKAAEPRGLPAAKVNWSSNLIVTNGSSTDNVTTFGYAPTANDARRATMFEPPMAPIKTGILAAFNVNSKARGTSLLSRNIVADQDAHNFNLSVVSRKAGNVTVKWPQVGRIPAKYDVIFRDVDAGVNVDMRQASSYTFSATSGIMRQLRVAVTLHVDSLLSDLSAKRIGTGWNDPEAITYKLAIPAEVSVTINQTGSLIRTILNKTNQQGGSQTALWDLRNENGRRMLIGNYTATIVARDATRTETKNITFYLSN
jgi:hypothetical protein